MNRPRLHIGKDVQRLSDSPTILFDPKPSSDLLSGPDLSPVIPAGRQSERAIIEKVASLHGLELRSVETSPQAAVERYSAKGTVLALGSGVAREARLYAHLTRREFRQVNEDFILSELDGSEVVITHSDLVGHRLLDALVEVGAQGWVPGLLCAKDLTTLRLQVMSRALASMASTRVTTHRVDVLSAFMDEGFELPGRVVYGAIDDPGEIRRAMAEGAGLVSVQTHSDGVDAFLGPDLTACSMAMEATAADPLRGPFCQATGICHRLNMPINEAVRSENVFPAAEIRARVLIWMTCWGLLSNQGQMARILDPQWGWMPRLLENPSIGAILTPWQLVRFHPADIEHLCSEIVAGTPVGVALSTFHRSAPSIKSSQRLCLLGDPRTRLPKPPDEKQGSMTVLESLPVIRSEPLMCKIPEANFLAGWLSEVIRSAGGEQSDSARKALDIVLRYPGDCISEGSQNSVGVQMRRAVIKHIGRFDSKIFKPWLLSEPSAMATEPRPKCSICGICVIEYIAHPFNSAAHQRRVVMCAECGATQDTPVDIGFGVTKLDEMTFSLTGAPPTSNWDAALLFESRDRSRNWLRFWPCNTWGAPVMSFTATGSLPQGPLRGVVIMMWGAQLAVFRRPARIGVTTTKQGDA